jgi:hypothetical protein
MSMLCPHDDTHFPIHPSAKRLGTYYTVLSDAHTTGDGEAGLLMVYTLVNSAGRLGLIFRVQSADDANYDETVLRDAFIVHINRTRWHDRLRMFESSLAYHCPGYTKDAEHGEWALSPVNPAERAAGFWMTAPGCKFLLTNHALQQIVDLLQAKSA